MQNRTLLNLSLSIGIYLIFAIAGAAVAQGEHMVWFSQINKPWFSLPMWGWYIIGGLYSIMAIILLYKVLSLPPGKLKTKLLILTLLMITGNECWNYLFFGLESIVAGGLGLLPFTVIVSILFMTLLKNKQRIGYILLPYIFWLVYDFVWVYALWKIN